MKEITLQIHIWTEIFLLVTSILFLVPVAFSIVLSQPPLSYTVKKKRESVFVGPTLPLCCNQVEWEE